MDQEIIARFISIIIDSNNFKGKSVYDFSVQRKCFSIFANEEKFISIFYNDKRYVYVLKPKAFNELLEIMHPQRIKDTNEFIIPEGFEEMLKDFLLVPSMISA